MESAKDIKLIFWLGTSVVLLLVIGVFFLVFVYQNYFVKLKNKQLVSDLEKQMLNQKLLLNQMNPHFIFNSIDNIQGLIIDKQDKEAIEYLTKFSKLTRQILENSNENYISLEEEVEMTQNYLSIQQLLYNNKFEFTISIDKKINAESIFLPPMLTQPFVENAIKHGLKNKKENGIVEIYFYLNNNKLYFQVTDNGQGFNDSKNSNTHKSLAMNITKERLINYTKNNNFEVKTNNIVTNENIAIGAKVVFEIPYIYEN